MMTYPRIAPFPEGYIRLDADMDAAFTSLYSGFSTHHMADFAALVQSSLPPFEAEMFRFFLRYPDDHTRQDDLFTDLNGIWVTYYKNGLLDLAASFWRHVIKNVITWERKEGIRVHKGTPYYFWAAAALAQGHDDQGFLLMHTALKEDSITHKADYPNAAALMFVTIDLENPGQFLIDAVRMLADYLDQFFNPYRMARGSHLTLADFRTKWLKTPPSMDAVFAFTHTLWRMHSLELSSPYVLQSGFASLYQLNLLFDFLLVIDQSLKYKDAAHSRKFLALACFLSKKAGLDMSEEDLKYAMHALESKFDESLLALLDQAFVFKDGKRRSALGCDLCIAYGLRNFAAHNVEAFPSIWSRYAHIRQSLFNVLFLTVDVVY